MKMVEELSINKIKEKLFDSMKEVMKNIPLNRTNSNRKAEEILCNIVLDVYGASQLIVKDDMFKKLSKCEIISLLENIRKEYYSEIIKSIEWVFTKTENKKGYLVPCIVGKIGDLCIVRYYRTETYIFQGAEYIADRFSYLRMFLTKVCHNEEQVDAMVKELIL